MLALQAFKDNDHQECDSLLERADGQTALEPLRVLTTLRLGEASKAFQMAETGLAADGEGTTFLTGAALSALACLRLDTAWDYLCRMRLSTRRDCSSFGSIRLHLRRQPVSRPGVGP